MGSDNIESKLEVHRETLEIAGGRSLYNYTFSADGKLMPPMKPEDVQDLPPEKS